MGMIIVSVIIMCIVSIMVIVMIGFPVPARFFLSLAEHIRLIPSRLYEYLESGVEVHDEYEEHDRDDDEYNEKKELESDDRDKREKTRYQKRNHEK